MLGLGHVLGYFAGTLDLMSFFGTALGSTQFKQVCVIASATITFCIGVTCFCVKERVLLATGYDGILQAMKKTADCAAAAQRRGAEIRSSERCN